MFHFPRSAKFFTVGVSKNKKIQKMFEISRKQQRDYNFIIKNARVAFDNQTAFEKLNSLLGCFRK